MLTGKINICLPGQSNICSQDKVRLVAMTMYDLLPGQSNICCHEKVKFVAKTK